MPRRFCCWAGDVGVRSNRKALRLVLRDERAQHVQVARKVGQQHVERLTLLWIDDDSIAAVGRTPLVRSRSLYHEPMTGEKRSDLSVGVSVQVLSRQRHCLTNISSVRLNVQRLESGVRASTESAMRTRCSRRDPWSTALLPHEYFPAAPATLVPRSVPASASD